MRSRAVISTLPHRQERYQQLGLQSLYSLDGAGCSATSRKRQKIASQIPKSFKLRLVSNENVLYEEGYGSL